MNKFLLAFFYFLLSFGQNKTIFSDLELTGQSNIHMIKNQGFQLLPEVAKSYDLMKKEALKDGIKIKMVSSFRSFSHQKKIWNFKFKKNNSIGFSISENILKIIEYSTIPGTSRHHWGTDIDIIDDNIKPVGDVLLTEKFYGNGPYVKLKKWLDKNSERFGLNILKDFLKIDFIKFFNVNSVLGSTYFTVDFIEYYKSNFLLGINSELKN